MAKFKNFQCPYCFSALFEIVKNYLDDQELHEQCQCVNCNKKFWNLYNIELYNTVTQEQHDAGDFDAGLD